MSIQHFNKLQVELPAQGARKSDDARAKQDKAARFRNSTVEHRSESTRGVNPESRSADNGRGPYIPISRTPEHILGSGVVWIVGRMAVHDRKGK